MYFTKSRKEVTLDWRFCGLISVLGLGEVMKKKHKFKNQDVPMESFSRIGVKRKGSLGGLEGPA